MGNIFLVSNRSKLTLQANNILIYINPNKELYRSTKSEIQIESKRIKNVFILNNSKLDKDTGKLLVENKVNVFKLDDMGNIEKLLFNDNNLEKYTFQQPLKVSKYILLRDYFSSFYLIKQQSRMLKDMVEQLTWTIPISLNAARDYSTFERNHKSIIASSYSMLNHVCNGLTRNTEFYREPLEEYSELKLERHIKNIVINYFTSLFYAILLEFFTTQGINPFISDNLWFSESFKNYPSFLRAFHSVFRIWIARIATETTNNFIYLEDYKNNKLNETAKMIISKIFSESFYNNYKIIERLEQIWKEVQKVDKGEMEP